MNSQQQQQQHSIINNVGEQATTLNVNNSSSSSSSVITENEKINVTIKAYYNNEIRRFILEQASWNMLARRICKVFGLDLKTTVLKYKDEDNELITFSTGAELKEALCLTSSPQGSNNTILRVFVFINNDAPSAATPAPTLKAETKPLSKEELKRKNKALKEELVALKRNGHGQKAEMKQVDKTGGKEDKAGAKAAWLEQRQNFKQTAEACKKEQKLILKLQRVKEKQEKNRQVAAEKAAQRQQRIREKRERLAASRSLVARFVKHVSIDDGTEFEPSHPFVKTWRFRNEGTEAWPEKCALLFISKKCGDDLGAPASVPLGKSVQPGEEVDISVPMVSPQKPGQYVGFWRLSCPVGRKFGQRVWVKITVVCSSSSSSSSASDDCMETVPRTIATCSGEEINQEADEAAEAQKLEDEVEKFFELQSSSNNNNTTTTNDNTILSKELDNNNSNKNNNNTTTTTNDIAVPIVEEPSSDLKPSSTTLVATPTPTTTSSPTLAQNLTKLYEMGFVDVKVNMKLLERHKNKLEPVIEALMRKASSKK